MAVAFAPPLTASGVALGELAQHRLGIPGSVLAVAQALPLVVRRRWPAMSLAVVAVGFAVFQLAGYVSSLASIGLFIALYSVGAHASQHRRSVAWAATGAYAALAIALALRGSPEQPIDWVTFYLLLAACWMAGSWVRARAAFEAARRRQSAELAKAAERARIARELHDVVTHHVTAMVVQADAAQFVAGDRARPGPASGLATISGTGRRPLAELRHLLGVLESPGRATPRAPVTRSGARPGPLTDLVGQRIQLGRSPGRTDREGRAAADGRRARAGRVPGCTGGADQRLKHAPGPRTVAGSDTATT